MRKIIIFILITVSSTIFAHPHIFTGVDITFVFGENGLDGIRCQWYLDDMTSSIVMDSYDKDNNDNLSEAEYSQILEGNTVLKENNYYFDMMKNGKSVTINGLEDFKAEYDDIYVVYEFFVPIELLPSDSTLQFEVYDKTYYSAFYVNEKDGIFFENEEKYNYSIEFYKAEKKAYYYGQVVPDGIRLNLKGKK